MITLLACSFIPIYADASYKPTAGMPKKLGGWYPVFFDSYSSKKLNQIINSINKGNVSKILISYDSNKILALEIESQITKKTKFPIELKQTHLQDNKLVQYNHKQVVVTVWNK